ncbi:MAG: SdpI family protein [Acutalibacteraceae bacterium]|nr:SdpI family protein [Acutalibacteraceae bacterium]
MIKNNKLALVLSSVVILMPIAVGLILWDKLPDTMVTHWNVAGNADGFASKSFAVFGMPLLILALHWICVIVTDRDKKNKNQNPKLQKIVLWLCPVLTWIVSVMMYFIPISKESDVLNVMTVMFLFIGLMFCVIGNYLPKCKQNFTLGIKIKWTLENEENWNKTHRLGGVVWFICGLIMIAAAFLPLKFAIPVMVTSIVVAVIVPTVYSYSIYRKMLAGGDFIPQKTAPWGGYSKKAIVISAIVVSLILIFSFVLMSTGDVEIVCGNTAVEINADYWSDISVKYEDIDSVVLRDNVKSGMKTNGFNSAKLLLGTFTNDEFGKYTRYTYVKSKLCIVIEDDGNILVLGGENDDKTREIYNDIIKKMN